MLNSLGTRADLRVVTVADGARDNWRFLDALAPEATAVVDFYQYPAFPTMRNRASNSLITATIRLDLSA